MRSLLSDLTHAVRIYRRTPVASGLAIVVLAVALYLVYHFLRKPMVTGDPKEMPPLEAKVSGTVDSVTSGIIHPEKATMTHPLGPHSAHSVPPETRGNGQAGEKNQAAARPGEERQGL